MKVKYISYQSSKLYGATRDVYVYIYLLKKIAYIKYADQFFLYLKITFEF